LIEGAADEVHELKFGYGTQAGEGGSESRADDADSAMGVSMTRSGRSGR